MNRHQYIREQERQARRSKITGGVLTAVVHAVLIVGFAFSGFTYLDPPPPEKEQILIDFEEVEIQKPKQRRDGTRPRAEVPSKEVKLVQ